MTHDQNIGLLQHGIGADIQALVDYLDRFPEAIRHVDRRDLRNNAFALRQVLDRAEAALVREAA